jgi:hypothetical protein
MSPMPCIRPRLLMPGRPTPEAFFAHRRGGFGGAEVTHRGG